MPHLSDRFFTMKNAYRFGEQEEGMTLEKFFWDELVFQLGDLEQLWVRFDMSHQHALDTNTVHEQYHQEIERVIFRLKEIARFISKTQGPKIVKFICTEVNDFIEASQLLEKRIEHGDVLQISVVFTVLNLCFHPEIFELNQDNVDGISQRLKDAVMPLLDRN